MIVLQAFEHAGSPPGVLVPHEGSADDFSLPIPCHVLAIVVLRGSLPVRGQS